jgi:hypothetical protein
MRNCSAITQGLLLFLLSFTGIPFEARQGYNGLARPFLSTFRGSSHVGKAKRYHTPVYLLLALALALLAGIPFMPQAAASPDEAIFYSSTSDGYAMRRGTSYSAVHGASSGGVFSDYTWLVVGQSRIPLMDFHIYRGALFFDTSSLPDDATISSAVLSLYGEGHNSFVDFEITVVDGLGLNEPLQTWDYGYLGSQNVSGGSFNTAGFTIFGYNDIPLNETGLGWISKTGITKFGLRSSRDIAATAPTAPWEDEYVVVCASEKGEGYQPRLVVTYTTPVGGEAYPIDKTSILAPWSGLALIAILATGAAVLALRRRRPA